MRDVHVGDDVGGRGAAKQQADGSGRFHTSDERRPRCSYGKERKNNAGCRGRSVATASHGGRCVAARQIDTTELKAAHDDPRHEPPLCQTENLCALVVRIKDQPSTSMRARATHLPA